VSRATNMWVVSQTHSSYVTHLSWYTATLHLLLNPSHTLESYVTHIWVVSHTLKSYVTHTWVVSHTHESNVTHTHISRHTAPLRLVLNPSQHAACQICHSCYIYESFTHLWVVSHTHTSHVTHTSCHTAMLRLVLNSRQHAACQICQS